MRTNSIPIRKTSRSYLSNRSRRDFDIEEIEDTSNTITSANKFLKPNSFKNISQNFLTSMFTKNPIRSQTKSKASFNQISADTYYRDYIENNDMEILQMDITDRVNRLILVFNKFTINDINTEKLNYARKLCSEIEYAVTSFTEKIEDGNITCHAHLTERGIVHDIRIFENIVPKFKDLLLLTDSEDVERDFYENITHIQVIHVLIPDQ